MITCTFFLNATMHPTVTFFCMHMQVFHFCVTIWGKQLRLFTLAGDMCEKQKAFCARKVKKKKKKEITEVFFYYFFLRHLSLH